MSESFFKKQNENNKFSEGEYTVLSVTVRNVRSAWKIIHCGSIRYQTKAILHHHILNESLLLTGPNSGLALEVHVEAAP